MWWKYRSDGQYESLPERRSQMTLEAVAVKDVGWYGCEVTSSNTNSQYSWTERQVFSFLRAQSELRATVPATLGCSVDAMVPMDSVTVRWVLDDVVKWTNSTSRSQSPDGTFTVTSRLSFTPTAEDDGRKCRCEASGGDLASTMVQEFILDVKYAPVVVNLSQDETCGGDLCILCEVKANPHATITWMTMESDASELIQTQRGDGTLTRSSLVMKRSQEQNVTCLAANKVGETEAVFHIKGGAGSGCWCVLSLLAPVVAWTAVGLCLLLLWRGAGEVTVQLPPSCLSVATAAPLPNSNLSVTFRCYLFVGGAGAHDKARPVHGTDTEGIRMEVATPATDLRSSPD
ncbi:myelin-associated glycoprotein-like [Lethenteron reissneri]|uniref:myelin-associated glycoprotein-like n=1 Tax=Lethenteron reissneri TaxID=7753 RepID=UPI002AB78729|nr:myelin-associated glycoprotein-like [Lethenteron reissneri]